MELNLNIIAVFALCCISSAFGNAVETTPLIERHMGTHVTVPCKFTTNDAQSWMFMSWKKVVDGELVNLANMQNTLFKAQWTPTAPANFKDHVELDTTNTGNSFELNMVIDGFLCSDVGEYVCEVYTMTSPQPLKSTSTLKIEVSPGMPAIQENSIEVKENSTFKIECNANVGMPPQTISWAYKLAGISHIYMKVMDGITQVNTPGPDCRTMGKSILTLVMKEEYDMATFLCSTSSELAENGSPKNFDEVTVQLYGKTTTTTTTTPAPSTPKHDQIVDDGNGAATIPSSVSAIILCCLATIFICIRTSS